VAQNWFTRLFRKAPEEAVASEQSVNSGAEPEGKKFRLAPGGTPITEFPPAVQSLLSLYGARGTHAALYRTQPEARTVIDFIANEVGAIRLKMYEKVPGIREALPSGRLELDEHDMILLLNRPAPSWGHVRLWTTLARDKLIYDVAYLGKVRKSNGTIGSLIRIPPAGLFPDYDPITNQIRFYRTAHSQLRVETDDLVIFHGYDPESNSDQVAPMETLRRILADSYAGGRFREFMWRNAARPEVVIERPMEAPEWGDVEREGFLTDWEAAMTGEVNSGKTAILEEGMKAHEMRFDPRVMEYLNSRKLTRMECAAAFGIDPVMVGARDRGPTKEDRTAFYVDRLVPLLRQLEEPVMLQLLPEFEAFDSKQRQYVEFNIEEKLKGSFEEQAAVMATSVGGPVMTLNEGRARLNLPPVPGGDEILVPLNSIAGGGPQASPQNPVETPADGLEPAGTTPGGGTAPPEKRRHEKGRLTSDEMVTLREPFVDLYTAELRKMYDRQRRAVKADPIVVGATSTFDKALWDRELAHELHALSLTVTGYFGRAAAVRAAQEYDVTRTVKYWKKNARVTAERLNQATELALLEKEPDDVFDQLAKNAPLFALARVNREQNWAVLESVRQSRA